MRDFLLPDLGEGLTEAEVIAWRVAVGDVVAVDQIVVEVETAKAAVEVPCPFAGVVTALHGAVGAVIDVGKPLISVDNRPLVVDNADGSSGPAPEEPADRALLDAEQKQTSSGSGNVLIGYGTPDSPDGSVRRRRRIVTGFGNRGMSTTSRASGAEVGSSVSRASTGAERSHAQASGVEVGGGESRGLTGVELDNGPSRTSGSGVSRASIGTGAGGARVGTIVNRNGGHYAVISPLVRRLARESGLDLATLTGTGPDGLIMRRDVEEALAVPSPSADIQLVSASSEQPELEAEPASERIPLRGLRKAVADKLTRSRREIPDATTWVDVDATALLALRDTLNSAGAQAQPTPTHETQRIGLLALFARICVAGLIRYPELNATVDTERQEIVRFRDINLGFAAQTDRGLVVPVVHGAGRMSTEQIAAEIERLTAAARSGSLGLADLTGSTFTLNNYGVYGVDGSTPILKHPEAAMLGVGRIVKKPWVVSGPTGGDELAIRRVTQLSFTFDHRVCDGGAAGGFLRHVADLVEQPSRLLRSV